MTLPNLEFLNLREEGPVLVVTVQRPEALNALNAKVVNSLSSLVEWLESGEAASFRAVVLTGAGEKAFVAGADIREFENLSTEGAVELSLKGHRVGSRLESLKIPVIAAVNGFALGGGLELALSCDFIYASENAKFGLPESTLGLMPGYGGTVRLPRRIGAARARELAFTGGMISAQEALTLGLVNKVVPQADLLNTCMETAKVIANRAPIAVAQIKRSVCQGMNLNEEDACRLEAKLFAELFATEDKTEGVRAFIEKRKPAFKGK